MKITSCENNLIYLELEVEAKCNLKCPYCCANSPTRKNKISNSEKIKFYKNIFKLISKLPFNFGVRIMGGEPTLFKHLNTLLQILNNTKNIKKVMLFTNGTLKLPFGKYDITTSLHPNYYYKINTILNNFKGFKNKIIFNVILPKFDDIKNINELKNILEIIKNKYYIHFQPIFEVSDNWADIQKYYKEFGNYNEYFDTLNLQLDEQHVFYKDVINLFLKCNEIECEPNCYQITEDLILKNDCENVGFCYDLKKNISYINKIKKQHLKCNKRTCYIDNCIYYKMVL